MPVLATYSVKGGVGKTTAAVNLAAEAARGGARTLLWDLDPQGAATFALRVQPRVDGGAEVLVGRDHDVAGAVRATDVDGLDLVPADFSHRHLDVLLDGFRRPQRRLRRVLAPLLDGYDYVFLDCAPSVSLVSEAVVVAADTLLVPLVPSALSVRTLTQLQQLLTETGARPQVLPFFSMVDRRKRMHRELVHEVQLALPETLAAQVPNASDVERMGWHRAPVGEFAPRSGAAEAFRALWREVAVAVGGPHAPGLAAPPVPPPRRGRTDRPGDADPGPAQQAARTSG